MAEYEEQGIVWWKSTASAATNCVEVALHDGSVLVRDSMNPTGAVLWLPPAAWSAFIAGARRGDPVIRPA